VEAGGFEVVQQAEPVERVQMAVDRGRRDWAAGSARVGGQGPRCRTLRDESAQRRQDALQGSWVAPSDEGGMSTSMICPPGARVAVHVVVRRCRPGEQVKAEATLGVLDRAPNLVPEGWG
jgi:hypothetical protein